VANVAYSIKLRDNQTAVLEVGLEGGKGMKDFQGKIITCNDLALDRTFIDRVNSGAVKIVLVNEATGVYQLNEVDKAIFIRLAGNAIELASQDADFVLYTDNLASEVNLAKSGSKQEVYLEGTLRTQCTTGYILRKRDNLQSNNYKEFTLIPEIGIVEKRAVTGKGILTPETSNTLKLSKVNNLPYWDYLTAFCDQKQVNYYQTASGRPSEYSDLVSKSGAVTTPTSYAADPCAPSTVQGVHVVQKGETLYGISRRYGISLDQLRTWNSLQGTDVIKICQALNVKAPAPGATTTTPGTTFTDKGTPAGTTIPAEGFWMSAPKVHVVRAGETVSMLANMYGYTEERFRKMNSLGPGERIYVGQKLHTDDCVCPTLESTTKNAPLPYEAETAAIVTKSAAEDVYFRPIKVHLVQQKETLFSIAQQYSTTPERIMELNGLKKGDAIKPDQRLYVQ
jgi:LysM repeat protein